MAECVRHWTRHQAINMIDGTHWHRGSLSVYTQRRMG